MIKCNSIFRFLEQHQTII